MSGSRPRRMQPANGPRDFRFLARLLIITCLGQPMVRAELSADAVQKLAPAVIEQRLPQEHPSAYYLYAGRLWSEGLSDDAVFWFYAGQLRFRFHLRANPKLDPSGDPALFASLNATLGESLNLYVGGDPKKWMEQIDRVLTWDEKTANGFTSKKKYTKELEEIRGGLLKLRTYVSDNQAMIAAKRVEEGIGTIGVVNGVYIEERRRKMPLDWPALVPQTTLAAANGLYEGGFSTRFDAIFFYGQKEVARATFFRLAAVPPDSLQVIALDGKTELASRLLKVRVEYGALAFDEIRPGSTAGLASGEVHATHFLRLNASSELVVERRSITTGTFPNKSRPVRLDFTFWNRAKRLTEAEPPPASQP